MSSQPKFGQFLLKVNNRFLQYLFVGLFFGMLVSSCKNVPTDDSIPETRPNFVLILADDISVGDFGYYGNTAVKTPNIDALAKTGLVFNNAYLTASQCSPTRCSLITGRYPHNTGAPELHLELPDGQPLFPLDLKNNGYYTAHSGKWHIGPSAEPAFDSAFMEKDARPGGEERWVKSLQNRPMNKPFFMWFSSFDAHRDWQEDSLAVHHDPKNVLVPPYYADTWETRIDIAKYYDEIQRLDRYVGQVVDELRQQGVYENTVIIFMADNGRPFPRDKCWLYDSGIKTPFIVHWPAGLEPGNRSTNSLISSIDLVPTILELAGLEVGHRYQGISFVPILQNPQNTICEYVFAEQNWHSMRAHIRMVRHKNYTYSRNAYPELCHLLIAQRRHPSFQELIKLREAGGLTDIQNDVFLEPRPTEQLFRVSDDSLQFKNLVNVAEHQDMLIHLREKMDQWQEETGDSVPLLADATPDRYDRITHERIYPGWRPPTGELPGDARDAQQIDRRGPR